MKKVKITTIILAIILISLVAFAGVYIKTQNRMENKVKDYQLGRELSGERMIEVSVVEDSDEDGTEINPENLTVENYKIVKKTIEERLKNLGAQDYTVSLNEEDGTIRVELPEDEKTDDLAYYLTASGKVQIKEKDADTELISDSMIKKAQYTYTSNAEGAYQVYLELKLTKEGQAKIEELSNEYAFLASEIDEIESATDTAEDEETATDEENTDVTNDGIEETDTTTQSEESNTTKKIAVLTISGTEYDIEKIEKNEVRVKMGGQTSNSTSLNNNLAKAAELSMLINSGKYPIEYEVTNNRFVYSDISEKQLIYFALIVAILILIEFIVMIIKYRSKGFLASISCIGFIAILSLLLRYTNVSISIEGIGAILLVIIINIVLICKILEKVKTMDVVDEATTSTYKEVFLRLVPVMIISLVFCFSGWSNLSSFGMIMFWGFVLIAAYNVIVTKTLLKLRENK